MKNTLVIARRELVEKRFVVLTAVAFAVLAIIVPFVPGVHHGERRSALAVASLIFSTGFTAGLAVILGSTIVGRELSDGRLSFYFAKPVPTASMWFGKLIAATLLIITSFVIIISPAFFAGITGVVRTWTNLGDSLPVIRIILGVSAAMFLLGHVISTFVRSRSAWLVFDFIAAAICGIAIWMIGRSLMLGYAVQLLRTVWIIIAIFVALAILAGGFWQLSRGRTDRKRSHIELSRFLWIAIGCALLLLTGYTVWVSSVSFSNLLGESFDQSRTGAWAVINGTARHRADYRASFLYHVGDGRVKRIPALGQWNSTEFSGDEKTAAFASRPISGADSGELYLAKLSGPEPEVIATGIPTSGNYSLSEDGSRAAVTKGGYLTTVYDLASRGSLGSVRIPDARWLNLTFLSNDVLRIYDVGKNSTRIFEYDIAKKALLQTGEVAAPPWRMSADKTRLLAYWQRPDLSIYDARTGQVQTKLPIKATAAKFLRDGRIVAVDDHNVLHVLTADGAPIRTVSLPSEPMAPIFDVGGGVVVVLVKKEQTDVVIDIDRGVIVRTEKGLLPAYNGQGPLLLCSNKAHDLLAWNPATGELRVVLKRA